MIQSRAQDNFLRVFFAFPRYVKLSPRAAPIRASLLVPIGIGDECLAGSHQ